MNHFFCYSCHTFREHDFKLENYLIFTCGNCEKTYTYFDGVLYEGTDKTKKDLWIAEFQQKHYHLNPEFWSK